MKKYKRRLFDIIQIGSKTDFISNLFDFFIVTVILCNLFVTFFETFDESAEYMDIIHCVEWVTSIIFLIEYICRLWTADLLFYNKKPRNARLAFVFSFFGLIDLLSFLPFFLPFVFPSGIVAFRIFRVVRIFRLFRVNAQYDAFNIIVDVLKEKKNQILSSVFIVLILMIASSMFMYSLEHEAQPENFKNAFSGIWWSASTLLTVGYGDIYPITIGGKCAAIVISFLGVGMVSIPTGIISAGFVEQYTKMKRLFTLQEEHDINFISSTLGAEHVWIGKRIRDLVLPPGILITMIKRNDEVIVPKGDVVLKGEDCLILASSNPYDIPDIGLKEIIIKDKNDWIGEQLKDLDISRQEIIVMIRRKNKTIIPNGNTVIRKGDSVLMYSKNKDR